MPIDEYPFIHSSRGVTWRPLLPIEIMYGENGCGLTDYAFVDTGAKITAFPFEDAEEMDIQFCEEDKMPEFISAGAAREAYRCILELRIFKVNQDGFSDDEVFVEDNMAIHLPSIHVAFVRGLRYPLLGVLGFLNQYVFTVNYEQQRFSIRTTSTEMPCNICRPKIL